MTTRAGKRKGSGASKGAKRVAARAPKAKAKPKAAPKARDRKSEPRPRRPAARKAVPRTSAPPKGPAPAPAPPGRTKAGVETRVAEPKRRVAPKRRMRRKEAEEFRRLLLERHRELVRAYSLSTGDSRAHPDSGTEDYIDYAVNSYTKEFGLSLSEMDRKMLVLVEEALARIGHGDYGSCLQCGEEIARKRLEVAPWARYCIRCQGLEEQGLLPEYPSRLDADEAEQDEAEESPSQEYDTEIAPEGAEDLEEEPLGVEDDDSEEAEED